MTVQIEKATQSEIIEILFGTIATACAKAVAPIDNELMTIEEEQTYRGMWLEVADQLVGTAIKFSDAIAAKMIESTLVDSDGAIRQ